MHKKRLRYFAEIAARIYKPVPVVKSMNVRRRPAERSLLSGTAGEAGGGLWRGQLFLFRCTTR